MRQTSCCAKMKNMIWISNNIRVVDEIADQRVGEIRSRKKNWGFKKSRILGKIRFNAQAGYCNKLDHRPCGLLSWQGENDAWLDAVMGFGKGGGNRGDARQGREISRQPGRLCRKSHGFEASQINLPSQPYEVVRNTSSIFRLLVRTTTSSRPSEP